MLSNKLIKSLCNSSNEDNLQLSEADWDVVLKANQEFFESESDFRGDKVWGSYLLRKLGKYASSINVSSSLELCCGNGFLYFSFRELFATAKYQSYIDISSSQCESFRNRCEEKELTDITIHCGDIGALPFSDNSLKLVYGNSFLHHLPDVKKYLIEANRVLERGGKFVVFHEPTLTAPFWESFPISLYKDTRADSLTDIWNISPAVIERLLRESGFTVIDIMPRELFSSIFVTPWQILVKKLFKRDINAIILVRLKTMCYWLDCLLPMHMRLQYSPSLMIYAEK